MINVCLKPPVLLPAVKCGTLCMSGFVGGCAPTSSKRQFPILYTVGSLFREAVPLEEMCYRMRPSPLPGGKASLLLRKGSETLREVPEQESCWVSGSLILSFFVRHENKEDGVFESRWDYWRIRKGIGKQRVTALLGGSHAAGPLGNWLPGEHTAPPTRFQGAASADSKTVFTENPERETHLIFLWILYGKEYGLPLSISKDRMLWRFIVKALTQEQPEGRNA